MRSEYAEECKHSLTTSGQGQSIARRKLSNVSSSSVSVIVIGGFGLKRAGTSIKCRNCRLFIAPDEESKHQLTCRARKLDVEVEKQPPKNASHHKPFKWLKKWAQGSSNGKNDKKHEKSPQQTNNKALVSSERPGTAVLDHLSIRQGQPNEADRRDSELDLYDRPGTAILDHPSVLNLSDANSVDMTLSVKGVNYLTKDNPSEISRPETVTLVHPTPNLNIPDVTESNIKSSSSTKKYHSNRKEHIKDKSRSRKNTVVSITNAEENLPVPCTTCDRSTMPERFHSHGPPGAFKASFGVIKRKKRAEVSSSIKRKLSSPHLKVKAQQNHQKVASKAKSFSILKAHQKHAHKDKSSNGKSQSNKKSSSLTPNGTKNSEPHLNDKKGSENSSSEETNIDMSKAVDLESNKKVRKGMQHGPPSLICYICGRNFGTKSLQLHEPHCLEVSGAFSK